MTELNVKFTVVIKSGNAFPTNLIHTTYVFCSKPMMLILQCVSFSLERKKRHTGFSMIKPYECFQDRHFRGKMLCLHIISKQRFSKISLFLCTTYIFTCTRKSEAL